MSAMFLPLTHYLRNLHVIGFALRKVPKFSTVSFKSGVVLGIGVSPDISQPNIKSSISQNISKTLIHKICQPVGAGGN